MTIKTTDLPLASTLLELVGNEDLGGGVKRTARMLYADLLAAAQAGIAFGPVGTAHSTGLVPDPGLTPDSKERVLFDDATWGNDSRLRAASQFIPISTSIPTSGYGGRVIDLEDAGIVPDYLLNGSLNPDPTDNAATFQAILNGLEPFDTLIAPPGYWLIQSQCSFPTDAFGIKFVSRGGYSNIIKGFNGGTDSGTALPAVELPPGLIYMRGLWFWAAGGTAGGIHCGYNAAGGAAAPEEWHITDCLFSNFGTSNVFGSLIIEGSDGPIAYGTRRCCVTNTVFHGNYVGHGLRVGGATGSFLVSGCEFVNGGSVSVADLWMTGSDYTSNTNQDWVVLGRSVDNVSMDWSSTGIFMAGAVGDITITANCVSNLIMAGFIGGTVTNSGVATRVEIPNFGPLLVNAANDGAAASAGVEVGEMYRNGSVLMVRVA